MVEDRLEILDKLLNNFFLDNTIIILGFLTDHDWSISICTKLINKTRLEGSSADQTLLARKKSAA
jgi:hypothetical protein